ncbi:MAG TPA: hypothetical protein PLH19_08460 [Anaerolineae bacterium]|nr:hypothetical protein [Anaerolineae bacterium]HQH38547.1 hypothetical protein [Anaerolineae bacterium]
MDEETLDNLIEIHDPEIDPAQIMEQIRERIQQRREVLGYPSQTFPTFGATSFPGEPRDEEYDSDLYYHLRHANEYYARLDVELLLAPSPHTRVPLLGSLWNRLRRDAHNLVLFYVNRLAQHQVTVNRHIVSVLNRMVVQIQEQQHQIRELQAEVRRLGGE